MRRVVTPHALLIVAGLLLFLGGGVLAVGRRGDAAPPRPGTRELEGQPRQGTLLVHPARR
jgi:hypothetical protein